MLKASSASGGWSTTPSGRIHPWGIRPRVFMLANAPTKKPVTTLEATGPKTGGRSETSLFQRILSPLSQAGHSRTRSQVIVARSSGSYCPCFSISSRFQESTWDKGMSSFSSRVSESLEKVVSSKRLGVIRPMSFAMSRALLSTGIMLERAPY